MYENYTSPISRLASYQVQILWPNCIPFPTCKPLSCRVKYLWIIMRTGDQHCRHKLPALVSHFNVDVQFSNVNFQTPLILYSLKTTTWATGIAMPVAQQLLINRWAPLVRTTANGPNIQCTPPRNWKLHNSYKTYSDECLQLAFGIKANPHARSQEKLRNSQWSSGKVPW